MQTLFSSDTCELPMLKGACLFGSPAHQVRRWFHDKDTHRCKPFVYSGCGGNNNNFATDQQCMTACNVPPHEEQPERSAPIPPCKPGYRHPTPDSKECVRE